MTDKAPAMPELPEPCIHHRHTVIVWRDGVEFEVDLGPRFTADQWRAYALATLQAQPTEVSDEEIDAAVLNAVGFDGIGTQEMNQFDCRNIARAILALRPQAVPMTDEQRKAARRSVCDDPDELPEPWSFYMGIRAAEAHHRITAQGAQGAAHQATKEPR